MMACPFSGEVQGSAEDAGYAVYLKAMLPVPARAARYGRGDLP